jgi:hypothetical protein
VQETVNVSAGIGTFNVSQALDFPTDELAFTFTTAFTGILTDPTQRSRLVPADCPVKASNCFTFYFPGALNGIYPSSSGQGPESADLVIAHNVQGFQLDFWQGDGAELNSVGNQYPCPVYGSPEKAFQICISPSSLNFDHLVSSTTAKLPD